MARAFFVLIPVLILFLTPEPARADDAPHAGVPIEAVAVRIDGVDFSFGIRRYPAPLVLDLPRPAARAIRPTTRS